MSHEQGEDVELSLEAPKGMGADVEAEEQGGVPPIPGLRLESTVTAEGEGESYVPGAVHGEGEELLIRAKAAVELLDLEALDNILPTFGEEADRLRLSKWEPFYKTAVAVRELLALRADVKVAVKEKDVVVLHYCRDKVLESKVEGVTDNIRKKTPFVEAEAALVATSLDKEIDDAFAATSAERLEAAMARVEETGIERLGRKLSVCLARCQYELLLRQRAERQERAKRATMRLHKPKLRKEELEELKQREEQGNEVFMQWKREKDLQQKAKMRGSRGQREKDEAWILAHEEELRALNDQAFQMWLQRKDQQRAQEMADERDVMEFFQLVDTIKKSREVITSAQNVERRSSWNSSAKSDLFPDPRDFSHAAREARDLCRTAPFSRSSTRTSQTPYATGRPFDVIMPPYAESVDLQSSSFNFELNGTLHSVPM